jgi:peptidoglycan/LPS O-acetylase OafA/YrhL
LIYEAAKFATLPTMSTYVPFSAWIDIPASWDIFLLYGVPVAIFLIGMLVAIWVQWKRSPSTLTFYISLVLVDAALSLAIYGVNFLGVGVL